MGKKPGRCSTGNTDKIERCDMKPEHQTAIEEINRHPDGIRTKIDKGQSLRVFLKQLVRHPFSTFTKSLYSENMPNVYYGYSDHPLDLEATPFQYAQSFLRRNKGRKANCVLGTEFINQSGNSFTFEAKGYDIYRVLDVEADGIQHTYRVDDSTPFKLMTLRLDFLSDDVYRVRLAVGSSVPENPTPMVVGETLKANQSLEITEHEEHYQIRTPRIRLDIYKQDFRIEVFNAHGELIAESGSKTKNEFANAMDSYPMGFIHDGKSRQTYGVENFTLFPGEAIYGLGERFDTVDKMGKTVGQWSFEGNGNTSGRTYKPIPFFMSTQGYGVFINEHRPITHWIGTRETCTHQIAIQADVIDYYFFYGPDFKHILGAYTDLTGKPAMVPKWSFGVWISRWSYYSQEQVLKVAKLLREMEVPSDVIHIDAGWFEDEWACDWTFSPERFPDPEGMFAALREMGFRVSLWQMPYVLEQTHQFADAKASGVLAKRGGPFVWLFMFPGSPIDFSNEAGVQWYKERLRKVLEMGASAITVDFGEQIEPHLTFQEYDGTSMHNLYPLLYNKAAFEAVAETKGEGIIWARPAYAGSQRYPVHWSGDNSANYPNIQTSLRSGLSLGLSGFSFWSQDTGGFAGTGTDELYIRWTQLSIFQSHIRFHGPLPKFKEIWNYPSETREIVKELLNLRYRLIPYLYSESTVAVKQGLPLLRHLVIEFQNDPTVFHIEDQFMCGRNLLIAPIMTHNHTRKVYLPEGDWFDFWSGERIVGKQWLAVNAPLDKIPVYVRSGTILPLGPVVQHTNEFDGEEFTLNLYPSESGDAYYQLHEAEQVRSIRASVEGNTLRVHVDPMPHMLDCRIFGEFHRLETTVSQESK